MRRSRGFPKQRARSKSGPGPRQASRRKRRSPVPSRQAMPRHLEWSFCFAAAVILASICIGRMQYQLAPVIRSLMSEQVTAVVDVKVSQAVATEMKDTSSYGAMIVKERDAAGNVTALTTNMAAVNSLKDQVVSAVTAGLEEMDAQDLTVPLGSLTGMRATRGTGPGLLIGVHVTGSIRAELTQDFADAGNKRTRHRLFLQIEVPIRATLAGQVWEETLRTEALINETIIVGAFSDADLQLG